MESGRTLTVSNASAGSGKTFSLAARYVACLLAGGPGAYRSILAVTFTNKATQEMRDRILTHLYTLGQGLEDKDFLEAVQRELGKMGNTLPWPTATCLGNSTRATGSRSQSQFDPQAAGDCFTPNLEGELKKSATLGGEVQNSRASLSGRTSLSSQDSRDRRAGLAGPAEMDEGEIRRRCGELFDDMLAHYDDVRVVTIDSFLQLLLAGLAQSIGLSASYGIELDVEGVVTEAVDQIMSTHIGEQPGLLETLSEFLSKQLDDERSWDVRRSLRTLAKELFKEAVQERDADLQLDKAHIQAFGQLVRWENSPEHQALLAAYEPLRERKEEVRGFKYGANHLAFLERVEALLAGKPGKLNGLGNRDLGLVESSAGALEQAQAQLHHIFVEKAVPAYYRYHLTTQHLSELLLLGYIRNQIRANLADANKALLAETASRLVRAMQPGDADFILEKAGIRFRHILLDEFQDTSTLQWENFHRLLQEILASGGTGLVVGDTKQSIYRWRNGNRHLMESLTPAHKTLGAFVREQPLRRNFRTRREIVQFNLKTFASLPGFIEAPDNQPIRLYDEGYAGDNLADYYLADKHEGGYVQVKGFTHSSGAGATCLGNSFLRTIASRATRATGSRSQSQFDPQAAGDCFTPNLGEELCVRAQILDDMFAEIESLLREGTAPSDIMILIRYAKEGQEVIRRFRELTNRQIDTLPQSGGDTPPPCGAPSRSAWLPASLPFSFLASSDDLLRRAEPKADWLFHPTLGEELSRTAIVSADSFLLDNSRSVNAVICGLKYILRRDSVAETYIRQTCPKADFEALAAIKKNLPLSEMLEDAIRAVLFPDGRFEGDDILYINSLRDRVRAYVTQNGSDAEALLTYWDDTMHAEPIGAAETQAIRLMTIHKAKGLEAKNVFIPFCDWEINRTRSRGDDLLWCEPAVGADAKALLPIVPISKSAKMPEAGYAREYGQEQADEQIDNLNLLYVALTRAADRLFVYTTLTDGKNAPHVGELLLRVHGAESEFVAGEREASRASRAGRTSQEEHPFSFAEAEAVAVGCYSGTGQVEFRQSQDSQQYTLHGSEEAQAGIDRRAFGNICHDILARSEREEDVARTLLQFVRQGIIRDEALASEVEQTLARAWENEQMRDWFGGNWQLLRETTILSPLGDEYRPDRVMIRGEEAIVLDYKFGQMNQRAYFAQVRQYMSLMRALGYPRVEGYIWLAEKGELIAVEKTL